MSSFYSIVFWLSLYEKTISKGISVQVIYSILDEVSGVAREKSFLKNSFFLAYITPRPSISAQSVQPFRRLYVTYLYIYIRMSFFIIQTTN